MKHDSSDFSDEEFKPVARPSLGPGLTETLNEQGYKTVAKLNNAGEMNAFIHRLINHLGLEVKDRNAILGVVPWYDGTNATQSYEALTYELLQTSLKPEMWVAVGQQPP